MSEVPSGTVTFVFTDIEGSTQRWERDASAMVAALRRHDAEMRAALGAHGGHVFKTIGDAFCAAFSRPQDAITAMLTAQRALASQDFRAVDGLRVRAAIHTGTADERDGDYFGPVVNRVARLLSTAHGGQTIVSSVAVDLLEGNLPPQASLRDLGEHRLKDLTRPEHVFQLLASDLQADFPPLRSLNAIPNNLPLRLTSFVGRETEMAEISTLAATNRLVTIVGSGGIGKTRTVLQIAANLVDGCADGVWFIELAPLASGEYVVPAIVQAMGLAPAPDGDPVANLVHALASKQALLVFDNCEHVVEPAARIIASILRACAKIRVLASSRQGLEIEGEHAYRLPSLAVPNVSELQPLTARRAMEAGAIELFVARASAADRRFALSDENAATIAEICRRLDGIALAIEMAAARVKILTPRQLSQRLDERFRLLTRGSRDLLPRQQTLRALIDWSYDLLDERERAAFRKLGIFVNGFTLEGAVAVVSDADLDELDTFEILSSLVEKSMVLAEPAGEALRYRLLESTRAYALEKIDAAAEREVLAARHLRYLHARFSGVRSRYLQTARYAELNASFAAELDDLRLALDGALASDVPLGGDLLANLDNCWKTLGLDGEGIRRCETFNGALHRDCYATRARLCSTVSNLAGDIGRKDFSLTKAVESVEYARASGEREIIASALNRFAQALAQQQKFDEADAALIEAEAISPVSKALTRGRLSVRAGLSLHRGDLEAALRAYHALRNEHRLAGNVSGEIDMLINLAEVEHRRGRTIEAIGLAGEAIAGSRVRKDLAQLTTLLVNLAGYCVAAGDADAGARAAGEAIHELALVDIQSPIVAVAIEHLALAHALWGDDVRAAIFAGFADAVITSHRLQREYTERTTHERLTILLRERLEPAERERLLAQGAEMSAEAAVAVARDIADRILAS